MKKTVAIFKQLMFKNIETTLTPKQQAFVEKRRRSYVTVEIIISSLIFGISKLWLDLRLQSFLMVIAFIVIYFIVRIINLWIVSNYLVKQLPQD